MLKKAYTSNIRLNILFKFYLFKQISSLNKVLGYSIYVSNEHNNVVLKMKWVNYFASFMRRQRERLMIDKT